MPDKRSRASSEDAADLCGLVPVLVSLANIYIEGACTAEDDDSLGVKSLEEGSVLRQLWRVRFRLGI